MNASWEFLKYLTSPPVILQDSLATGHLPTRASVEKKPKFKPFDTKYPGAGTFAQNLRTCRRPGRRCRSTRESRPRSVRRS